MSDRKFKQVEGTESQIRFVRPSELAETGFTGVVAEGEFVESMPNKFNPAKKDFKIIEEDGTTVILNGTGSLEYKMKNVSPGDYIQVHYLGQSTMTKGTFKGKLVHNYNILVAE